MEKNAPKTERLTEKQSIAKELLFSILIFMTFVNGLHVACLCLIFSTFAVYGIVKISRETQK